MPPARKTIPEGLDLITTPQGIVIRKTWFSWTVIPLAIFAVVWDAFLLFWYTHAFSRPDTPLMMVLFPLGHVAVGLGITYLVIASFVNKTDVTISSAGVQVATGPVPWLGNKQVNLEDLREIIVRMRSAGRGATNFQVMYADRTNKERKLVSGLSRYEQAEYIEEIIRETIGLPPSNE